MDSLHDDVADTSIILRRHLSPRKCINHHLVVFMFIYAPSPLLRGKHFIVRAPYGFACALGGSIAIASLIVSHLLFSAPLFDDGPHIEYRLRG